MTYTGDGEAALWTSQLGRLSECWAPLFDKPSETPESTLQELWLFAAGVSASESGRGEELPELSEAARVRLQTLVQERCEGKPLSHLTGRQLFMGLELLTSPDALIPRVETELLARFAVERLSETIRERGDAIALDLCTGSGNIAAALAFYCPTAIVYGSDISEGAIRLAERNAAKFSLEDRLHFRVGDLFGALDPDVLEGKVDFISCNPPYIPSSRVAGMPREISEFEPEAAFNGGALGLDIIIRLYSTAKTILRPDSWLCFEVGAGQGDFIARRMERAGGYSEISRLPNQDGEIRVIAARTEK